MSESKPWRTWWIDKSLIDCASFIGNLSARGWATDFKREDTVPAVELAAVKELAEALKWYTAHSHFPLKEVIDVYEAQGTTFELISEYVKRANEALAKLPKELIE